MKYKLVYSKNQEMDTLSYIKYKIKKVHQEGGFYESINYYIIISVICSGDVCVRENSARSYINDRVLRSGRYWSFGHSGSIYRIHRQQRYFICSNVYCRWRIV